MRSAKLLFFLAVLFLPAIPPAQGGMPAARCPQSGVRRFALLIGIDHYRRQTGFEPLKGAVNDVENLQHVLTSEYGFQRDDVVVLLNERATADGIVAAFRTLSKRIRPGDLFVFYFSGHGTQLPDDNGDEKRDNPNDLLDEAIVPFDALREKTGIANLIRDDRLGAILNQIAARHQVAIFDCCHSGTGTRTLGEGAIRGSATGVAPADSGHRPDDAGGAIGGDLKGGVARLRRVVLSACAARQRTREVPLSAIRNVRIGLFTYYFVEGLRGAADVNGDGRVSYAEVHRYVQRRIHDFRNDGDLEFQHQQTPQLETVGPATFADDPVFGVQQKVPLHTPIAVRDGLAELPIGAIHGVRRGQILGLYPSIDALRRGTPPVGRGEIVGLRRSASRMKLLGRTRIRATVAAPLTNPLSKPDVFIRLDVATNGKGRVPSEVLAIKNALHASLNKLPDTRITPNRSADLRILLSQNSVSPKQAEVAVDIVDRIGGAVRTSRRIGLPLLANDVRAAADALLSLITRQIRVTRVRRRWGALTNPHPGFRVQCALDKEPPANNRLVTYRVGEIIEVSLKATADCRYHLVALTPDGKAEVWTPGTNVAAKGVGLLAFGPDEKKQAPRPAGVWTIKLLATRKPLPAGAFRGRIPMPERYQQLAPSDWCETSVTFRVLPK